MFNQSHLLDNNGVGVANWVVSCCSTLDISNFCIKLYEHSFIGSIKSDSLLESSMSYMSCLNKGETSYSLE